MSAVPTPAPDMPAVSVIVPHYDDAVRLDRCLSALARQDFPAAQVEIIVADNRSPLPPGELERVVGGRARIVIADEKGAGPARNAGAAAARGRILAFTDADCLPEPGWISAGVAALERADIAGGHMVVMIEREGGGPRTGAEAFETVFAFDNRTYVERKGFSVTANLFCPRRVFDAVGPFKNGLSEDLEWCHRARDRGFSITYAADATVAHPARADWAQLLKKWKRLNIEAYNLQRTRPMGRARWAVRSLALPVSILPHARRVMRASELETGVERRRAMATLVRLRLWRFADSWRLLAGGK